MKLLPAAVLCVLLRTLTPAAADPFVGVWKMRPSGKPGPSQTQTLTIEPAQDAMKFTIDIVVGNGTSKLSMTYITKMDGAAVPVYSGGKRVMTVTAKRTGPRSYEGSTTGSGGITTSKTTLSADGKTMIIDSVTRSVTSRSVFDRVK